ncbi:COPI associated protein-domain-containing protein [Gilbertella persicaria]|uniref:COPI associated protein-domain-containing protein n=1 Tax=Gilbertella persicaria TaxID=101096 RepID=UPI00221FD843|nr:COPI associated protein-domain-containing protein [Gilbertella persicaria]KAI8075906.1 COPI associated protein-domain-containing protein [Gilbertella persicaria]
MNLNYSIIFRVANIVAAAFMIIGGVMTCFAGGFPNFIQGIFVIIFGIITAMFEFRLPAMISQYASFMFSFMGRAIFYIFIGCITLNYGGLAIASGVIVAAIGIAYVVLHFLKTIEAPSNMQKRAFEDAVGYSSPTDDATTHQSTFVGQNNNPTYQPSNYANPTATV